MFSFLSVLLIGPFFIKWIKTKQFGQTIREEGPTSHKTKKGTPIFGGILFLLPTLLLSFFFLEKSYEFWFLFILIAGYGSIGFADDFIKIFMKRNLGLSAKQKIFLQLILSTIAYLILLAGGHDTNLYIPLTDVSFDLSFVYFPFFLLLAIGTTNATNLTDGLDGLLSGLMIVALSVYSLIAYQGGQTESMYFATIMIGALLGFLYFNRKPAQIFMGDTGSLALGGLLAAIAVLTKTEILLVIIGGVFVAETLSVILQVTYYKKTGKRLFKMSPLHHHFELKGWSEQKVVSIFYIAGMVFAILALFMTF